MLQIFWDIILGAMIGAAAVPLIIAAFLLSCIVLASLFAGIIVVLFQLLIWAESCYYGIKQWFKKK